MTITKFRLHQYSSFAHNFVLACESGNVELVDLFLSIASFKEKGDFSNRLDIQNGLNSAAQQGHVQVIQMLLSCNKNSNSNTIANTTSNSNTINFNQCMIQACEGNHVHIVEWMVQLGASNFDSVLQSPESYRFTTPILNYLLPKCNPESLPPYFLTLCSMAAYMELLIKLQGPASVPMAFSHACRTDQLSVAKYLFQHYPAVLHNEPNLFQDILDSHVANNVEMVQFLFSCGAKDVQAAFYYACNYDKPAVVEFLIDRVTTRDINICLEKARSLEVAKILVQHGAQVTEDLFSRPSFPVEVGLHKFLISQLVNINPEDRSKMIHAYLAKRLTTYDLNIVPYFLPFGVPVHLLNSALAHVDVSYYTDTFDTNVLQGIKQILDYGAYPRFLSRSRWSLILGLIDAGVQLSLLQEHHFLYNENFKIFVKNRLALCNQICDQSLLLFPLASLVVDYLTAETIWNVDIHEDRRWMIALCY
jgi:hypothetical protein